MKERNVPEKQKQRHRARILRFLAAGPAKVEEAATSSLLLLDGDERGSISIAANLLEELLADGLVLRSQDRLELAPSDLSGGKDEASDDTRFRNQHMDIDYRPYRTENGYVSLQVNLAESPLAQLTRRKNRSGKPFLSNNEFLAGERLRADYTRGQIMPRLGANWEASVASSPRNGNDGIGNLTDAALSARMRVNKALEAVGPELAGPLIDICCFLKGIEQVEAERGWPARSAKLLLKTALAALSRHYEPAAAPRRKNILHWGTQDYKPSLQRC